MNLAIEETKRKMIMFSVHFKKILKQILHI